MSKQNDIMLNVNAITPGHIKVEAKLSYEGMGKKDGETIKTAIEKAQGTMREILLWRCLVMIDETARKDWLRGFGEIMGDTKKSEAKAVFEAWAKDAKGVADFQGEFNAWITECRNIRGAVRNSPAVTVVRAATPAAIEKATETMKKAKLADVVSLVDSGMAQLVQHTKEAWEPAIVASIAKACEQLKKSQDEAYLQLAANLIDCINDFDDERQQVQANMIVESVAPVIPSPAVSEVLAA